ncbi:hypothetical protein GGX14DRAFT_678288 [Mycena pura]|uniref:Uncharacterized protein n=1 Tax=Mycena pura TaxID=153505 RepID=A0AAD6UUB1_9AGAR|nr:hypothetical protein GGX14DRAFT_678288 [Mycena pura]
MTNCPGHHARCGDGIGTQSCGTAVESASLSAMTNCPGHHARCLPLPCDTFPLQLRFRALFHRAADVTGALDWPRVPRNRSGATLRAHWRHLVHPAAGRDGGRQHALAPVNGWQRWMKHGTLRLETPISRQNIVGAIADCAALRAGVRSFEERAAYVLYSMATSHPVYLVSQLAAHERMPTKVRAEALSPENGWQRWRQTACSGRQRWMKHGTVRLGTPKSRQKIVGAIADCSARRTGVRSFEERAAYVLYGDGAPSQLAAHAHQNCAVPARSACPPKIPAVPLGRDLADAPRANGLPYCLGEDHET